MSTDQQLITQADLRSIEELKAVYNAHCKLRKSITDRLERGTPVEDGALQARTALCPAEWSLAALSNVLSTKELKKVRMRVPKTPKVRLTIRGTLATSSFPEDLTQSTDVRRVMVSQLEIARYLRQIEFCRTYQEIREAVKSKLKQGAVIEAGALSFRFCEFSAARVSSDIVEGILGVERFRQIEEAVTPRPKRRLLIVGEDGQLLGWHK